MNQLPAIHFGIDEVPICGAITPNLIEQTPHLMSVTCETCLGTLRALKPPVNGLPLDIEHTGTLFVHARTLRLSTSCLMVEHKWVFSGRQHWRCRVEDSEGHSLGLRHGLLVDVGVRLPETLNFYLYNADHGKSWKAEIVTGRTRGGSAPRCVDIEGPVKDTTMTVRSFIGESDRMTDEEHLSRKIGEYARHMLDMQQ